MMHLVARTVAGRLLFETWEQGLAVWAAVLRVAPAPVALCVMPDHLHLLVERDVRTQLGRSLSGLTRHRNHHEGRAGALFEPLPSAEPVTTADKRRRSIRYVHLNPCRARLVADPLDWPLSTHRDAVGLTWPRVGPARDPLRFHAYVSADPTAQIAGTELPATTRSTDDPKDVLVAVSAVCRVPIARIGKHALARAIAVAAMDELCPRSRVELADLLGVARSTVFATGSAPTDARRAVGRVLGDPRFGPLDDKRLRDLPAWRWVGARR